MYIQRVLFLDDNSKRHIFADAYFKEMSIVHVSTAAEAIEFLSKNKFAIVSLDHDLLGNFFSPSDEFSGMAVAEYIVAMPEELRPEQVIVHTGNKNAGDKMMKLLSTVYPPTSLIRKQLKQWE